MTISCETERDRLVAALEEIESWKIRHQDEVNARVKAENDLYAMQQERRREHSLRVKFAGEVESYRKLLVSVRALINPIGSLATTGEGVRRVSNALELIDAALSPQEQVK